MLENLETDSQRGLTREEALRRLAKYGANKLKVESRISWFRILLSQFKNALIAILIIAAVVSAFLGEAVDAIVILIIVVLVAILGFTQEYRTEKVLSGLKKMLSQTSSVFRDGELSKINSEELVPGDIVLVEAGDRIASDMRIIQSFNVQTDEAPLSGESVPVEKNAGVLPDDTPVADRVNMLFSGTVATNGKARAVVTATGMKTEFGKIAWVVAKQDFEISPTSLDKRMDEIGKQIGIIVLVIIALISSIALIEEYLLTGSISFNSLTVLLLFTVALAVAAVPEALPAIVVGSLAIGAHRMAKSNALVRNLSAVETLGATQIVCTDKTGTLTKGEMTVKSLYAIRKNFAISGAGYEPVGKITGERGEDLNQEDRMALDKIARAAILCNDASLVKNDSEWSVQGDPTEGALIVLGEKAGLSFNAERESRPRIWEVPFSSETKRMITLHSVGALKIAYMKGSPESVIGQCEYMQHEHDTPALDSRAKVLLLQAADSMASRALRVLAIAEKTIVDDKSQDRISTENDFVFLGLVGMIDPPRPEAIEAIKVATRVGMKPIMITGDHKLTAVAIAKEMGIYGKGDIVLTGEELEKTSDEEFENIVENTTVYARVTPFQKLRIVEAWKKKNWTVAMTGDGVNDAPALKRADIGIAMGITGTQVAKDASDLVLLDDNFATIIKAVELGRWIRDNVKKYLAYLLSANLIEIAVMSIGILLVSLLVPTSTTEPLVPLLAVQILYINLATDGLPSLAVGAGPPDPDVMERPPSARGESVFSPEVRRFIAWTLVAGAPLLTIVYLSGLSQGIDDARTRLFLAFVFVELALALNCRSLRFTFDKARPHKWLILSVLWEAAVMLVLLASPVTREPLHLVVPSYQDIGWTAFAALVMFGYVELVKRLGLLGSRAIRNLRSNI